MRSDLVQVRDGVLHHFKTHYKRSTWSRPKISDLGTKQISTSQKEELEVVFSYEEVWKALCSCDGNKAPDRDGLNLNFIKKN